MPIFDFKCLDCGEQFEALVLKNTPACPACESVRLEQQVSMFAVDSASIRQANIATARKANAKTQRDKAIADAEAIRHHDD
ncbi:MAG TPA: zinc ribbon domain-containing protein [Bryobacteraceae bacterium]|nr:zinc ribbon domain-containing protein [Bryobacteraceae bacterium]